jgi:hypothetical protein
MRVVVVEKGPVVSAVPKDPNLRNGGGGGVSGRGSGSDRNSRSLFVSSSSSSSPIKQSSAESDVHSTRRTLPNYTRPLPSSGKSEPAEAEESSKMSSEEVAELAQAIHNHADVLYESWKKGQEAFNMKRMEDTLELLADPGLTPKLEHLVSTFVRRDKAKRQQFQQQLSPPPEGDPTQRESSPSGSSLPRKPLPKSILAVVQRFETQGNVASGGGTSSGGVGGKPEIQRERSPVAGDGLVKFAVPGVGAVTKNVLWAETINKHQSSERILDRMSPVPSGGAGSLSPNSNSNNQKSFITEQSINLQSGNNGVSSPSNVSLPSMTHNIPISSAANNNVSSSPSSAGKTVITPTGKVVRHIPIERLDEPTTSVNKPMLSPPSRFLPGANPTAGRAVSVKPVSPVVFTIPDEEPQKSPNNNGNKFKASDIQALELEEEKLFQALRTGQVLIPGYSPQPPPSNGNNSSSSSSIPPREKLSPNQVDSNGISNSNSRVAFAKERIRQSQEHPLTQQRLEMQKRLPSPSGSLAAAIAMQQGKLKFQQSNNGMSPHHHHHHHVPSTPATDDEPFTTSTVKENGRNSFVRFGPGATVADRVQLFEKYPSHIASSLANNNSHLLNKTISPSHSILTSGSSSSVLLSSQEAPWPKTSNGNSAGSGSVSVSNGRHVGGVNGVQQSPHHQTIQQQQQQPTVSNNVTAPWRTPSPVRDQNSQQQHIITILHDQVVISNISSSIKLPPAAAKSMCELSLSV